MRDGYCVINDITQNKKLKTQQLSSSKWTQLDEILTLVCSNQNGIPILD